MTNTLDTAAARTVLPGARLLRQTAWLFAAAGLCCIGLSLVLVASHGGGLASPNPTGDSGSADEITVNAVMHASPVMFVILGAIAFVALIAVLRVARDEAAGVRILTRATLLVVATAVVALIVGYAWFFATPLSYWTQTDWHYTGFPLVTVDVSTTQMATP